MSRHLAIPEVAVRLGMAPHTVSRILTRYKMPRFGLDVVPREVVSALGGVLPLMAVFKFEVQHCGGACQMVCVRGGSPYGRKHTVGYRQGVA